jgi:ribosomal protein S18 acetylase RimI-like enzyme
VNDLAWRVEAACREAWPCPDETILGGWLIRASGGQTRRTNSVNPLPGERADVSAIVDAARAIYSGMGQPLIFRVPTIAQGVDAQLDRLGFGPPEAETITLHATLRDCPRDAAGSAQAGPLDAEWLAARASLSGWEPEVMQVYQHMLGQIACPAVFASVRGEGRIVAVAYGAIAHGLLVIESVITNPPHRRQGHGRQVVAALLNWAQAQRVDEACLQVVADNAPALALYRGLGFARELYRYHYRRPTAR